MFSFFNQVIEFFGMIIRLIEMLINGVLMVFTTIPKGLVFLLQIISYLPSVISAFAVASVMLSVTFLIVGRQGRT